MASSQILSNANGKFVTLTNPDTNNNNDVTVDVSKIASTVSPALTGTPTAPTASAQDNSTKVATTAYVDGKFIRGTAVATTSGTAIDFTGIPSWVKRITVMFNGVSTSGTSGILIRVGDSSGVYTTGYIGGGVRTGIQTESVTTGFAFADPTAMSVATAVWTITATLILTNTNQWTWSASAVRTDSIVFGIGNGYKLLTNQLDRLRITTANGTDAFDAGSINIMYEG